MGREKGLVRALVWGGALSGILEASQLFLVGRFTSLADLMANTLGAGLGAAAGRSEGGALIAASVLGGLGMFAPVVLLAPAPPEGVYYGQWTAVFGNMEPYEGRVLDAHVGEVSVPSWMSPSTEQLRKDLGAGSPVRIRLEVGPAPSGPAPVFSIFDDRQRGILLLGADGHHIFVRLWRRGTSLRFGTPTLWWKDAFSGIRVGDTVQIIYEMGGQGPCLTIQGRMRCQTATSAVGSWSLLAPGGQGGPLYLWGSLIWAMGMGIPMGLLGVSPVVRGSLALGTTAGVAALSSLFPYWPTPWTGLPLFLLGTSLALIVTSRRKAGE